MSLQSLISSLSIYIIFIKHFTSNSTNENLNKEKDSTEYPSMYPETNYIEVRHIHLYEICITIKVKH